MRGDIYFVELSPRSGSEQRGRRPCVIVSTDAFNRARGWRSVTVIPLTTSPRWLEESHTTVVLQAGEANLPKRCAALAHQITTIDRTKLDNRKVGSLSAGKLKLVETAILNYLAIGIR